MITPPRPLGQLAIVLHAHLPFVRHPEHAVFLEEDWFYEALTEAYLPLLGVLDGLWRQGRELRLTLSISPPLAEMMADPLLAVRYQTRLDELARLAAKERHRTANDADFAPLARLNADTIAERQAQWQSLGGRPLAGFKRAADRGQLELMTTAATHGYLPILRAEPAAVRAQIRLGLAAHVRHFGRRPRGFWLPECAYYPGLDAELAAAGVDFFITDAHGLELADPPAQAGPYAPVRCAGSGIAAFARDRETAQQVWSRDEGYPGDPWYREFYRDIGFDLPSSRLGSWLLPDGGRRHTGLKYHRITGPGEAKEPYVPARALERVAAHADHFIGQREAQLSRLAADGRWSPLVVACYDAELFGHWWHEGPAWLEAVLDRAATSSALSLTHLSTHLDAHPGPQVVSVAESSWGDQGYHAFWLDEANAWIYPHLHRAAGRMVQLAGRFTTATELEGRALNQAARELLLAQSSDWAFIMKAGTAVEYAVRRTRSHLRRFARLAEELEQGRLDGAWLGELEARDNHLPRLDYRVFAG